MKYSRLVFLIVATLINVHIATAQRMLLDQRYLNEFPSVERIKAEIKRSDDLDTYARFVAALSVINQFMINDLLRAPNGGMYTMPPAADKVHDRYRVALTYYEIDNPEPHIRNPNYRPLRNKYENDPAFADWLLQKFFSPQFRSDYYAWTRRPIPPASAVTAIGATATKPATTASSKVNIPKPVPCPKVSMSGRTDVDEGTPTTFTAHVTGLIGDATVTYNWVVSAGTISSGQGTSSITVDTTREGGATITATVSVGGLDPKCASSSSYSSAVTRKPPPAMLSDSFGTLTVGNRNARLDNFALQVMNDPTVRAYIICYAGPQSAKGAAGVLLNKIKTYLVSTRGIDPIRIVTVDGGHREKPTSELWIVPHSSTPPDPSPTVSPSATKPPAKKKRG